MYSCLWSDLPEVEVAPNNFRRSVSGLGVGINLIRWVHPTGTPPHVHADTEKAVLVLDGTMKWFIGEEVSELSPVRILVKYYEADLSKKFARSIEKDILPAAISE